MKHLTLVRGLPGCGKTSFVWAVLGDMADLSLRHVVQLATDSWFMVNGVYKFDGSKLGEYHAKCLEAARVAMREGKRVWVHNTFSCRWEMEPYLQLAREVGYRVDVIDLYDGGLTDDELCERGEHSVPIESIADMRERWEHDWKNGNPIPPWERKVDDEFYEGDEGNPTLIQEIGIANMAANIASGTDPIHEAEEAEKIDFANRKREELINSKQEDKS